jgi:hypothetical protein
MRVSKVKDVKEKSTVTKIGLQKEKLEKSSNMTICSSKIAHVFAKRKKSFQEVNFK